jgi:hypothetical protein
MLLANPKTLAAMEAKQIEAGKNTSKGSAKKGSKSESKDTLASLPNIADLLQLSADSTVAASGLGTIDFSSSPVQQQQSRGTELLIAQQPKEASPPPPSKPRSKLSPTRLIAAADSPVKRSDPSPHKQSSKAAGRDKSGSPAKGRAANDKAGKSPGKGRGGDSKDTLAQAADYAWSKREAELRAEIEKEKEAVAGSTTLVADLRRDLTEARQRLVQVESGSELSSLQLAVSNLEQLLRQSEQDRVALLQVSEQAAVAVLLCDAGLQRAVGSHRATPSPPSFSVRH